MGSVTLSPADSNLLTRLGALAGPRRDEEALGLVLAHFRALSGTVHRVREGVLALSAHSPGIPPQVLDAVRVVPIGKGMAGLAAQRKAPVTACNLQTDSSGDVRPGARATGLKGSLVVPLLLGDEVRGTLGIGNLEEREFTPAETELLLAAGRVLARS
jgi:GAF domain-containing protein